MPPRQRTCRDCKTTISRSAKTCPKCGARKPNQSKVEWAIHQTANALMGIGSLLTIIAVLVYCA